MKFAVCYFLMIFMLFPAFCCHGQKLLQMEKKGSFKTWKFYAGEVLDFEIDGQWVQRKILDFNLEQQVILFENGFIHLHEIDGIRTPGLKRAGKAFSATLWVFGASWVFWSLADWAVGGTLTMGTAIVSGTAFIVGSLVRLLFKKKKHKIGKGKRLRLLDVTPYPVFQGT